MDPACGSWIECYKRAIADVHKSGLSVKPPLPEPARHRREPQQCVRPRSFRMFPKNARADPADMKHKRKLRAFNAG
jgi:hypothetical protein